jgi:FKBP-type peptidyl-prolyl cis-trans isomerase
MVRGDRLRRLCVLVCCCAVLPAAVLIGQHRIPELPPTAGKPVTLRSGLVYIDIHKGRGVQAQRGRIVRILYTAWITKTQFMFDYRDDRSNPLAFRVGSGGLIDGLEQGVVGMRVGGKRRLIIPSRLGHGEKGTTRIAPNSDLTYDVELVAVARPGA